MIFVTVGTHEQPFNRLIQKIDELKKDGTIQDDVIIQTGFSTYEPKYCQWSKLIPYQQMVKNVADARIVITHGHPHPRQHQLHPCLSRGPSGAAVQLHRLRTVHRGVPIGTQPAQAGMICIILH